MGKKSSKIGIGVVISTLASVIAIFTFTTGIDSIPQILGNNEASQPVVENNSSQSLDTDSTITVREHESEQASSKPKEIGTANLYINNEHGFYFYYPKNWVEDEMPDTITVVCLNSYNGVPPPPNLNIMVYSTAAIFPSDFQREAENTLNYDNNHQELESLSMVIKNGNEYATMTSMLTRDDKPDLFFRQYFYEVNDYHYMLTFTCSTDQRSEYEPIFESIMDTFTIVSE